MTDPVLSVREVVKRYGTNTVLDGISLDVHEHEVVTVIGSSGSGKSTLLRCVNLLEELDDGQVLLDGVDVSDPRADVDVARRGMGIVFQAFNLFPHMSVLDNITLAPRVVHGVPRDQAEQNARDLLERVGLAGRAGSYPSSCPAGSSSGWRSPGRWPTRPGCCCWTRSPARWTRNWSARCWRWSESWRRRAGRS